MVKYQGLFGVVYMYEYRIKNISLIIFTAWYDNTCAVKGHMTKEQVSTIKST